MICVFDIQLNWLILIFFLKFCKVIISLVVLNLFVALSWFLKILLGQLPLLKVSLNCWQVAKRAWIILTLTLCLILVQVRRSPKRLIRLSNTHIVDIIHLLIWSSWCIPPFHVKTIFSISFLSKHFLPSCDAWLVVTELLYHLHLVFTLLFPAEDVVVGLSLLQTLEHCLVVHHYSVEFFVPYALVQGVFVVWAGIENWIGLHILSLSGCEEVAIQLTLWFFVGSTCSSCWHKLVTVSGEAHQSSVRRFGQRHFVAMRRWIFSLNFALVSNKRSRLSI